MSKFIFLFHFAPALRLLVYISLLQRSALIQLMQYIFLFSSFIWSHNGKRERENGLLKKLKIFKRFYEFRTRWILQLWSFIFGPRWDEEKCDVLRLVAVMAVVFESENVSEGWKENKNVARTCASVIRVLSHACEAHCFANTIAVNWVISKVYKHLYSRRNIAMK